MGFKNVHHPLPNNTDINYIHYLAPGHSRLFSPESTIFCARVWWNGIGIASRVARWFVFNPKKPFWVNFGGPYLDWKMFIHIFMFIWNILWRFGKFYEPFSGFGIMYQEKSGNPDCQSQKKTI
jgi:hypothetical protein